MNKTQIKCPHCGEVNESSRIACIECDIVLPRHKEFGLSLRMGGWRVNEAPNAGDQYHVIEYAAYNAIKAELAALKDMVNETEIKLKFKVEALQKENAELREAQAEFPNKLAIHYKEERDQLQARAAADSKGLYQTIDRLEAELKQTYCVHGKHPLDECDDCWESNKSLKKRLAESERLREVNSVEFGKQIAELTAERDELRSRLASIAEFLENALKFTRKTGD